VPAGDEKVPRAARAPAWRPTTARARRGWPRGYLASADNQIDTATGTVRLRAQFENGDSSLFPNQFVNVAHAGGTPSTTPVIVPGAAIQRGQRGTFVYVVKPDNSVTVRNVTVGPPQGDRVSIDNGSRAGETGGHRRRGQAARGRRASCSPTPPRAPRPRRLWKAAARRRGRAVPTKPMHRMARTERSGARWCGARHTGRECAGRGRCSGQGGRQSAGCTKRERAGRLIHQRARNASPQPSRRARR